MNERANAIVLTGGTRGLGLSHARCLAEEGYDLAIVDLTKAAGSVYGETESVDELIEQLSHKGNKIEFFECDLTDASLTKETFALIRDEFGSIGSLIANAGGDVIGSDDRASGGKAPDNSIYISLDHHDQVFDRNYRTCLNSLRAAIPHLIENGYGKIVTTSSISAGFGVPQETAYSVAKAAVAHLTKSVAVELRDHDITANCVAPGGTITGRFLATMAERGPADREKILDENASFLKRPADPAFVSSVVKFLISRDSDYVSGQVIRIDGGQFTSPI